MHPNALTRRTSAGEAAAWRGRVRTRVLAQLEARRGEAGPEYFEDGVYRTIYEESRRLQRCETRFAQRDRVFLDSLRKRLPVVTPASAQGMLREIIEHYLDEISGEFDSHVYDVAVRVLPPALSLVLHGARLRDPKLFELADRIVVEGEVQRLERLTRVGSVVLVPTHVSNLDAFIMGWVLHELQLPPFSYGAGLNLYAGPLRQFCMGHLGAFTVDRSKTDPVYRTTLKEYATALLERQHMLFFPGGTRSRSGALESHLKLGLLGTGLEAMRRQCLSDGLPRRIFFVPCTLSYPLVLEAESLIREYLRNQGGSRYFEPPDEFERLPRWFDLLRALARLRVKVHVRVGSAMDPFGNPVDEEGLSRDPTGRAIDPAGYLCDEGGTCEDLARDAEYTRILAGKVLACYRRDVVVLPTHVVAMAAYSLMQEAHPDLDLFRFLHRANLGTSMGAHTLRTRLARVLDVVERAERQGELLRSTTLKARSCEEVLSAGLDALSAYHQRRVLVVEGELAHVKAPELLFYYQNHIAEHLRDVQFDTARASGGVS